MSKNPDEYKLYLCPKCRQEPDCGMRLENDRVDVCDGCRIYWRVGESLPLGHELTTEEEIYYSWNQLKGYSAFTGPWGPIHSTRPAHIFDELKLVKSTDQEQRRDR